MNFRVEIKNKEATVLGAGYIVCGNSDYSITFAFDSEWAELPVKTARFVYARGGKVEYQDVVFEGSTVDVPVLRNIDEVYVGVFAGDLHTTTPARILCKKSILCGDGSAPSAPTPDVYAQIIELVNTKIVGERELPAVTATDKGKVLGVNENGEWVATSEIDEAINTIPLVVDEVLILPSESGAIKEGYKNSIDLDSLNKIPVKDERFWGLCKTTDNCIYSFVAKCTGEITQNSAGKKFAVFVFEEAKLIHDLTFRLNAEGYVEISNDDGTVLYKVADARRAQSAAGIDLQNGINLPIRNTRPLNRMLNIGNTTETDSDMNPHIKRYAFHKGTELANVAGADAQLDQDFVTLKQLAGVKTPVNTSLSPAPTLPGRGLYHFRFFGTVYWDGENNTQTPVVSTTADELLRFYLLEIDGYGAVRGYYATIDENAWYEIENASSVIADYVKIF